MLTMNAVPKWIDKAKSLLLRKPKLKPNWEIRTCATCELGDFSISRYEIYAADLDEARVVAKRLAARKEREIGESNPRFSLYEDGSYPDSIGIDWSIRELKALEKADLIAVH
jgi:hypothetical protein